MGYGEGAQPYQGTYGMKEACVRAVFDKNETYTEPRRTWRIPSMVIPSIRVRGFGCQPGVLNPYLETFNDHGEEV